MAIDSTTLGAGGPAAPARPLSGSRRRTARRIRLDAWVGRFVVVGGIVIIASILAILFVIAAEVYPLLKSASAFRLSQHSAIGATDGPALGSSLGVDEYREIAYEISRAGMLEFMALRAGPNPSAVPIVGLVGAQVTAVAPLGKDRHGGGP